MKMSDLPWWAETPSFLKFAFVVITDRGDIPPVTIAERNGKVTAIIIAPQVDKEAGLHAAAVARVALSSDTVTVAFDAHMYRMKAGETEEDYRKRFPPGSMQKMCDEEGACERGELVDVLSVQRYTPTGTLSASLTYDYHGKAAGQPFKWLEEQFAVSTGEENEDKLGGFIHKNMLKIMEEEKFEGSPLIQAAARITGVDPTNTEKLFFHSARAGMHTLRELGFLVMDFVTEPGPFGLQRVLSEFQKEIENSVKNGK